MYLCIGWGVCQAPINLKFNDDFLSIETLPLYEFFTDLDDALLEPLKKIWALGADRECFDWGFANFDTKTFRWTVGALSPQEQKDLGGIRPKKYWHKDPTESKEYFLYT